MSPDHHRNPSEAEEAVRAALAAADRRRRARETGRVLWRAAPFVAAAALAVAIIRRWTLWPAWTPAAVLLFGAAGLAAYALVTRRRHAVSDHLAAAIDNEADLGGELRSASWFAGRETRDDWAQFHLIRAAERLRGVDWAQLYPGMRAVRMRTATGAMVIGALVLSVVLPERAGVDETVAAAGAATDTAAPAAAPPAEEALSPELLKQLEALLAAAERGDATAVAQLSSNTTLRDLLNRLAADPELLAKLTRALAANQDALKAPAAKDLKALAERSRKAADLDEVSPEMREMLEKIAEEAELAEAEEAALDDEADPAGGDGPKQGETAPSAAAKGMQELSVQVSRQAEPAGGAGIMMMSKPDEQSSGPPGSGVGGSGSQESAAAAASAALAAALSHEIVEASQDRAGDNVDTDIRRKTEQGSSTVAFTRSAAGKFDASRVAPPPAVPEGRRTGVQSYFIRKSP